MLPACAVFEQSKARFARESLGAPSFALAPSPTLWLPSNPNQTMSSFRFVLQRRAIASLEEWVEVRDESGLHASRKQGGPTIPTSRNEPALGIVEVRDGGGRLYQRARASSRGRC